jgi:hypothetical protein
MTSNFGSLESIGVPSIVIPYEVFLTEIVHKTFFP